MIETKPPARDELFSSIPSLHPFPATSRPPSGTHSHPEKKSSLIIIACPAIFLLCLEATGVY
jgi:hypothetical protein